MALTEQQFQAWLESDAAIRCTLVEVQVYNGSSEQTLYLSTKNYVTGSSDTPSNTTYLPVLSTSVQFSESIIVDGSVDLSFGGLVIDNYNGEYDSWLNYVWANRPIKIYFGDVRAPRGDFTLIFSGIVSGITSGDSQSINLAISDVMARFNVPITEEKLGNYYQGNIVPLSTYTNPNRDQVKPLVFGEVHNITPLLIDPTELEYMVHNGPIESIIEIRDNGVPLISGSGYTVDLVKGTFKLLANPAGTITCSVQGDSYTVDSAGTTVAGYSNKPVRLVQRILRAYGRTLDGVPQDPLLASEMDLTTFNTFNTANQQSVGVYISTKENVLDVCNQIAQSVGLTLRANRTGSITLAKVQAPISGGVLVSDDKLLEDSVELVSELPVVASVKLGYCRNYTIQDGLLTGIPEAHKDLFAQEWLVKVVYDSAVKQLYKLSAEPEQIDTLMLTDNASEVTNEATRLLNLYKVPRRIYRLVGTQSLISIAVGSMITLKYGRFNLSAGVPAQVLLSEIDWDSGQVTLEVLV